MLEPSIQQTLDMAQRHYQAGRYQIAAELLRNLIAAHPALPDLHRKLGMALGGAGDWDGAIIAFASAIAADPNSAESHNGLGVGLAQKGRLKKAIAAFGKAIALAPKFPEAHFNLGNALRDGGQFDDAIAAFRHAATLRPNYAEAHNNLANVLKDSGHLDQALAAHRQAIAANPDAASFHSALILTMHYHPATDAQAIAQEEQHWNDRHATPLGQFIRAHSNDANPDRRLRVGYVSADFYDHACGFFLSPLFGSHDRTRFEIFCYSTGKESGRVFEQIKNCTDGWRSVAGLHDAQIAARVREDRIDVLVDLKLHTADNRLLVFAEKPAPVQICWLGYPGSTGLQAMDYRLTDLYLEPPGLFDAVFSERPIRLPHTVWCYDPLATGPEVNESPCLAKGFVTFGCLGAFCKMNDEVLKLWARTMHEVPNSRLLLLAPEGSARRRTLERFAELNIGADRLRFAGFCPRDEYLQRYHEIDIALDTFPYNGHTTSLDSLWMGIPVVSLIGNTPVGRVGLSMLNNIGLPELATDSSGQYVEIARDLAADVRRLKTIRSTLRARMEKSPLMDGPGFARCVEAAYRQAWRLWCSANAGAR